MTTKKITIENNTCIVSSYLLDELDYIVGGYGKPTIESIFSLNSFIEAYILSSHFVFTKQEFDHINITSKVLFPNGRPIFDLIGKSGNFFVAQGYGNQIMQCVYVESISDRNADAASNAINSFVQRDAERILNNFILSDLSNPVESVKTFTIGFAKNQVVIGETNNKPFEIVKSFYDDITNYNIQSALPIFTYKQQFNELRKKATSREIYKTICDIQGQEIDDAEKHLGGELQAIPPLVSIVLSKSKTREDIPRVMQEIRNDFTDFRKCCEDYEKSLNEGKTIKEQMDAHRDYKRFWATLVKKYTDKTSRIIFRFIDIVKNDSDYEDAADNAIDSQSATDILKDLNLGKVAGKAGILVWDKIKEKRILNKFKGVVDLWSLLENSPNFNAQIKNIERLFNVEIDRNRLHIAKEYLKAIEKTSALKVLPARDK